MECRQASEIFASYLSDELAPTERGELLTHLDTCPSCRAELAGLKEMWILLGQWRDVEPHPAIGRRLHRQVRWLVARDAFLSLKGWTPSLVPAALGVLLSVGLSFLMPYDALIEICRRAVGGLVPEPGVFLMAGLTYGLLPLAMVMWLSGRRRPVLWRMKSPLLFLVLISPYAIFQCLHFPGPALAGFLMGLSFGAFLGGVAVGQRWGNRMTCER